MNDYVQSPDLARSPAGQRWGAGVLGAGSGVGSAQGHLGPVLTASGGPPEPAIPLCMENMLRKALRRSQEDNFSC